MANSLSSPQPTTLALRVKVEEEVFTRPIRASTHDSGYDTESVLDNELQKIDNQHGRYNLAVSVTEAKDRAARARTALMKFLSHRRHGSESSQDSAIELEQKVVVEGIGAWRLGSETAMESGFHAASISGELGFSTTKAPELILNSTKDCMEIRGKTAGKPKFQAIYDAPEGEDRAPGPVELHQNLTPSPRSDRCNSPTQTKPAEAGSPGPSEELKEELTSTDTDEILRDIVSRLSVPRCQSLSIRSHGTSGGASGVTGNGTGLTPSSSVSKRSRRATDATPRKKSKIDDDDGDFDSDGDEETNRASPTKIRRPSLPKGGRLACHFFRLDPDRFGPKSGDGKKYKRCGRPFESIKRLKDHYDQAVAHKCPDLFCRRCQQCFKTDVEYDIHFTQNPPCDLLSDPDFESGLVFGERKAKLHERRKSRTSTEEEEWYIIWDIFFPGICPPVDQAVFSCAPVDTEGCISKAIGGALWDLVTKYRALDASYSVPDPNILYCEVQSFFQQRREATTRGAALPTRVATESGPVAPEPESSRAASIPYTMLQPPEVPRRHVSDDTNQAFGGNAMHHGPDANFPNPQTAHRFDYQSPIRSYNQPEGNTHGRNEHGNVAEQFDADWQSRFSNLQDLYMANDDDQEEMAEELCSGQATSENNYWGDDPDDEGTGCSWQNLPQPRDSFWRV